VSIIRDSTEIIQKPVVFASGSIRKYDISYNLHVLSFGRAESIFW